MNLTKFLNEVDTQLEKMDKEKLINFIHEIARTLPEQNRDFFFSKLEEIQKGRKRKTGNRLSEENQDIRADLERIENGELCLVGNINEEYDDWYNSDEEEFIFEDSDGVINIIDNACKYVHQCIEQEAFQEGYQVVKMLMDLQIIIEGEYSDYGEESIGIEELQNCCLGTYDYKHFAIDAIYIAYFANKMCDRAEHIYAIIEKFKIYQITLEMVMQNMEELPQQGEFLILWIEYLGIMTTYQSNRLIKEALELLNNDTLYLKYVRKYVVQHPSLYNQYLQVYANQKENSELLAIGKEALETIDERYTVRSSTALLTSTLALHLNMQQEAEHCWLEAFRSDTTVVNFFRLLMESVDFSRYQEEIKSIYHQCLEQKQNRVSRSLSNELHENQIGDKMADMLAFLCGEFQNIKEKSMNIKDALGWSFTFMKCGLAAFLLLLLESDQMQIGGGCMCSIIIENIDFSSEKYQKGTSNTTIESDKILFWKCFCRWKKEIVLSAEEKQQYLGWIEGLIAKRVEGIMEANRRNYYGECAGYVAALGEVYETSGERGGKQRVLLEYKNMYSRRRAFHDELRKMGMVDRKK